MHQRKKILYPLIFIVTAILLLGSACSGTQTNTEVINPPIIEEPTEEVAAEQATFEEAVVIVSSDSQIEPASKPSLKESEPTQTPTTEEQSPLEPIKVEAEIASPTSEAAQPTPDPPDPSIEVDPSVGSLAPDFVLTSLTGETFSLVDLQGKNILINYWATWCPPCIKELPMLENLHQEYAGDDFIVITINGIEQDNLNDVQATVTEQGVTLPVLLDEGETFWDSYRILFLPTSIYIDEAGVIRFIKLGEQSEAEFFSMVEQLLSDQL
jgi:thiol-disulfide isomerase/thioredoxin